MTTKSRSIQYRQGDVFITKVDALPAGATEVPRDEGRIVLAYGEVTGHCHAITEDLATLFELEGSRFLVNEAEAFLRHEEHGTIDLPPGVYEVRRQREYSPDEIRNVAD